MKHPVPLNPAVAGWASDAVSVGCAEVRHELVARTDAELVEDRRHLFVNRRLVEMERIGNRRVALAAYQRCEHFPLARREIGKLGEIHFVRDAVHPVRDAGGLHLDRDAPEMILELTD